MFPSGVNKCLVGCSGRRGSCDAQRFEQLASSAWRGSKDVFSHGTCFILTLYSASRRPVMSGVLFLSGLSGLSLDFPFLSPLLFFCLVPVLFLSCHSSASGPFS